MIMEAKEEFRNLEGHPMSYWNQYPAIPCDVSSRKQRFLVFFGCESFK